jgi:hypothetical protein
VEWNSGRYEHARACRARGCRAPARRAKKIHQHSKDIILIRNLM